MNLAEKTLADEIITIVKSVSNNNPPPETVTIKQTYDDNHVDIEFADGGTLNYVPSNAKGNIDDVGVCVYLNGDINNPFIILAGKGEDGNLSDYVKKEDLINKNKYDIDLNMSFGLKGQDDTITIDMDIVNHIVNKEINI